MTTALEEFIDEVVGGLSDGTSPKVLVLPSGLMSSGKTTTINEVIESVKNANVDIPLSRHESDNFRNIMTTYKLVPGSWAQEIDDPHNATIGDVIEWTSESQEDLDHEVDWDAEVEDVVPRPKVYDLLGEWTLNSEGITLYDGSNDRNHETIKEAAKLDSDVILSFQPVADDAWQRYIEPWDGDPEEFLKQAGEFVDIYGDVLEEDLEYIQELEQLAGNPQEYRGNREDSLNPLMEDLSRVMSQPDEYVTPYTNNERFREEVESLKQSSGRLAELAENIQQQDETKQLAEQLAEEYSSVDLYYVEDITSEGENRYGHEMREPHGTAEDLGEKVKNRAT